MTITLSRVSALRSALSEDALNDLAREVVIRMAQARTRVPGAAEQTQSAVIDRLCASVLSDDPSDARFILNDLQESGLSLDRLYVGYLAEAAVRLGQMWEDSEASFVQVTVAAWRLYELVHDLRDRLPPPRITRAEQVLFALVPGEEHSLGVEMAAELFRQHGWDVSTLVNADHDQILAEIDRLACVVLGLSSGGESSAEALARLVLAVRAANPAIHVVISGQVVRDQPDFVRLLAPDSAVATVEEALAVMARLSGGDLRKG
ncbi:cobalamin B12-binding domain-containing protein [Aestuariicoccus sp. KMU-90]|uniref:Cobalamin B12-binding domain-containing protein n=1 Tax=Thetidibacter halocola TaxID=2827239 RepID=A0A8J8B617_9RHOB|nr:cobalamin B12-binding domain-containing protein [Thetidibacter halocola]